MLSAGQITIRFKQILDKSFLSKRIKLALVKKLWFLSTLIPYLKDVAPCGYIVPVVFASFLYVVTYITSC